MPPWILVTPSSRGIGLALASRLLRTTTLPVVATTRGSKEETKETILADAEEQSKASKSQGSNQWEERLHVVKLDFKDEESIASAAAECRSLFPSKPTNSDDSLPSHLHLAFVIPGILHPEKSPSQLDLANITETFQINTISHLLMLKHFSPFLPRKSTTSLPASNSSWTQGVSPAHATWAAMSAKVGSISDNGLGGWYSYRSSKAAVNQIAKTFDNYLRTLSADKALAISVHPGTVKTGLSKEFWSNVKEGQLFSKEYSAERLCDVVKGLGAEGRGKCWSWNGKEILP